MFVVYSELGTLEWINFNPDFSIRISTVETFHFSPNPLFFSLLGYPLIVFSNENISVLSLVVRFSLIGCYSFSDDYSFSYTFKIILQDYVNLEIIKKRGSSINPLFFLISRLNIACSPLIFNLQINYLIRIKDISF